MDALNQKMFLGVLCKRRHDFQGSGKSRRYKSSPGVCVDCNHDKSWRWAHENPVRAAELKSAWWANNRELGRTYARRKRALQDHVSRAYLSAKGRRDTTCTITEEALRALWATQSGKCYWLGIEMDPAAPRGSPAKPTLDRLVPALGYVDGNVVWSSSFANLGRNNTSAEAFRSFIDSFLMLNGEGPPPSAVAAPPTSRAAPR